METTRLVCVAAGSGPRVGGPQGALCVAVEGRTVKMEAECAGLHVTGGAGLPRLCLQCCVSPLRPTSPRTPLRGPGLSG